MENTITQSKNPNLIELPVSKDTNVGKLAAAIKGSRVNNPEKEIVVRYVGAGAGNQALKGVIIANRMLASITQEQCMVYPDFGENIMATGSTENLTVILLRLKFFPLHQILT